jgi:hypothetical protein
MNDSAAPEQTTINSDSHKNVPPKKGPVKKKQPNKPSTGASGVTPIMRTQESNVKVMHTPERTYYLLNVISIVSLAFVFESFVRMLPRPNPGHVPGNYASAFILALICKLTRVSDQTNQFRISASRMPSPLHLKLPPFLCNLIDCFGEFKNPENGVVHAPYITENLLKYLYHLADLLLQINNPAHLPPLLDPANHRKWILQCYGAPIVHYIGMCQLHDALNIGPYAAQSTADQVQRVATALTAVSANIANGVAQANADITATIGAGLGVGPHSTAFVGGAYAPGNVPVIQFPVPHVAMINAIRANLHGPNWEAIGAVAAPIPAAAFDGGTPPGGFISVITYETDAAYLEKNFVVATPSIQPFGNAAPTGVTQNSGPYCTVSTSLHCITAKEGIMAAILNSQFACWVNASGTPYDLRDSTRQTRTTIQGLDESGPSLLAKCIKESMILRK